MIVRQSLFRDQLHIFGLMGIAVAYPLFSFLLANPAYLVANGMSTGNLYIMIALLSLAIPAILIATGLVLNRLQKKIYRGFHLALVWILLALAFMPVLSRIDVLSVWLVFAIAAAFSVLATREYHTNLITYTGLLLLAPVGLALPVHFALDPNINQILNPKPPEDFEWQGSGSSALPPVVLIVFDELPLVHILDERGGIDRKRFPNFAALGDESTWYSNASTVHDQTIKAVPAILSGLYPEPGRILPVPENYPQSLFALLLSQYRIHASESLTALADVGRENAQVGTVNTRTVATDMAIFYLRSLLPAIAAASWFPLQNGIWGGFVTGRSTRVAQ